MGLDITAYSRLRHLGEHPIDPETNEGEPGPWCYAENHIQASAYDGFDASFRGIPILRKEGVNRGTVLLFGGCYEETSATKTHRFRAGSYSGYGAWRQNLASQFNPVTLDLKEGMSEPDPDGPFYELIWFADDEGTIGPDAAKDLLADFLEHALAYQDTWDGYGAEKYRDWTRAFELAADGGLVDFH